MVYPKPIIDRKELSQKDYNPGLKLKVIQFNFSMVWPKKQILVEKKNEVRFIIIHCLGRTKKQLLGLKIWYLSMCSLHFHGFNCQISF